jgi:undecaprenyl-diphosphatase
MVAFVVTAGPAYLLSRVISENLESLLIIGLSLLIGGVVMWVVDVIYSRPSRIHTDSMERMAWLQAVWIGAIQVLAAVFPGVSRSMATIAAGQTAGLSRTAALEFSFFVSIPVMFTACGYDLLKTVTAERGEPEFIPGGLTGHDWGVLATGFAVSFVVALGVIAWFMAWVRRRGFVPFAIYRILLGGAVTAWALGAFGG